MKDSSTFKQTLGGNVVFGKSSRPTIIIKSHAPPPGSYDLGSTLKGALNNSVVKVSQPLLVKKSRNESIKEMEGKTE